MLGQVAPGTNNWMCMRQIPRVIFNGNNRVAKFCTQFLIICDIMFSNGKIFKEGYREGTVNLAPQICNRLVCNLDS